MALPPPNKAPAAKTLLFALLLFSLVVKVEENEAVLLLVISCVCAARRVLHTGNDSSAKGVQNTTCLDEQRTTSVICSVYATLETYKTEL